MVAAGGRGGRGNKHRGRKLRGSLGGAAAAAGRPGIRGQECKLLLELKSLAHVGLIGFPNVGKSTLLRALTAAHPNVAAYAFTTLRPQLGVVAFADGAQMTVADTPGLIEGAHANRGLGHAFLRHVERCACLVFVLDMTGGVTDDRPRAVHQLRLLRHELERYDARYVGCCCCCSCMQHCFLGSDMRTSGCWSGRGWWWPTSAMHLVRAQSRWWAS